MQSHLPDHFALHKTYCRWARNADERRFSALVDQFHPNATIRMYASTEQRGAGDAMGIMVGIDEIIAHHDVFFQCLGSTHHLLANFVTEVSGDIATQSAYMRVYHRGTGGSDGLWEESLSMIDGTACRSSSGNWLITALDYTIVIALGSFDVFGGSTPEDTKRLAADRIALRNKARASA